MDDIFEPGRRRAARIVRVLLPAVLPILLCGIFLMAITRTSRDTIAKEQTTLTQALENGAVYTYSLTGSYPESLSKLLDEYHITYDKEKFIIEYVPNGSNLFPMISVLPRKSGKGGLI